MAEQETNTQSSLASTQLGKQQGYQNYSVVKTYCVSIILLLMGFYFLVFAIIQLITNFQETSYYKQFTCTDNMLECKAQFLNLSFPDQVDINIYLYKPTLMQSMIETFNVVSQDTIQDCSIYATNGQLSKDLAISGANLNSNASAYPCGQIAYLYPQAEFTIKNLDDNQFLTIKANSLSLFSYSFVNTDLSKQWADVESQRFAVWSERNIVLGLKKYWGKIEQKIPQNLQVKLISTNKLEAGLINGLKVELTNNKALTGYNLPLVIINFLWTAAMMTLSSLSFWLTTKYRSFNYKENKKYDQQYGQTSPYSPQYFSNIKY